MVHLLRELFVCIHLKISGPNTNIYQLLEENHILIISSFCIPLNILSPNFPVVLGSFSPVFQAIVSWGIYCNF